MAPAAIADDDTSTQPSETTESTPPTPPAEQPAAEDSPAPQPADDAPATESGSQPTPDEPTPTDPEPAAPSAARGPAVDEDPSGDVGALDAGDEPAYAPQSIRLGSRLAPGTWVPRAGTTTGTRLEVVILDADGTELDRLTCTTEGEPDADGITYCPVLITLPAGTSADVTEVGIPDGLEATNTYRYVPACELTGEETCKATDVVFEHTGPLPTAVKDKASTEANTPVLIDVLANDTSDDPATAIAVTAAPAHGTTAVVERDGRQQIEYTPAEGFTDDTDRFTYTVTTSNGQASAQVAVAVGGATPNYGERKFYVGVQIADGSYVPAGTTTLGSELQITTTAADGTVSTITCVTSPASCIGPNFFGSYTAPAGSTVRVVQTKAAPGLTPSDEVKTIEPCDLDVEDCDTVTLTFTDTGLRPETSADSATTRQGQPVRIDVLANDDSEDPSTTLSVGEQPGHGTAQVVGSGAPVLVPVSTRLSPNAVPAAGSLAIVYTPAAGFSGRDTFRYAVTNSNGTTFQTVTIDVIADPTSDDDTDTEDGTGNGGQGSGGGRGDDDAVLPDTGGADARLLGVAGLLLAAGGWLTAQGRRRRPGAHLR